ncbi:3'(2'),5'-bisphosphate nucleotidase CysQ [Pseudovibrio sp. Tun.PSC04-5.I4]|uniref:3'(2'),5'-bisphosphate nucleotidase CysQ n=1 Tax=Pseudovibrio sp. Tun.PSC04-5.I4 TaxID=1798213 RepID=UPI0008924005|nr:3'(2'),5'-bisphosphate nucleotidase CysQ [Pseudovibrio sp. Tun.PSC04-5.I4]SDR03969.1 3'(2'),5'-bisphosphate nucleotidase [Pseudovibrio sp. Tun.PSC04-5.I4]
MIAGFKLAALEAGQRILEIYEEGFQSQIKGDGTPVTIADQQAEEIILIHLSTLCPDIPVVAEEAMAAGHMPEIGDRFILVDPLDGTREFISRNGEFTVNIALIENGRPTVGVIFAPVTGELFWGDLESGAFKADVTGLDLSNEREMACSKLSEELRVLASRSHRSERTDVLISKMGNSSLVAAGSSLKFCRLAEGKADFYPRMEPTMEWDTAAGQAILCAAGGHVVVEGGEPLIYGKLDTPQGKPFANPCFLAVADQKIISHYGLRTGW